MSPSSLRTTPGLEAAVFCTLFDSTYLLKGLVMLESFHRHARGATVYVLCMDDRAYGMMQQLDLANVRLLRLDEVEDDDLRRVKGERTKGEYCWTLSPALCRYVIGLCPHAEFVTYLDADLMFFSEVAPLFAEMGDASIAITEHRYPEVLSHLQVYGRFNVQWVVFRRDDVGMECLDRWRAECIEWCHAWLEEDRLGDQKYLDAWPGRYGSAVHLVAHPGAGVGPWNVFGSKVDGVADTLTIDGRPLIFYHYHQFQLLSDGKVDYMPPLYLSLGSVPMSIYRPYQAALEDALGRLRRLDPTFDAGIRSSRVASARRLVQRFAPAPVKNLMRRIRLRGW